MSLNIIAQVERVVVFSTVLVRFYFQLNSILAYSCFTVMP